MWIWSYRFSNRKVSPHHQITMLDINNRALALAEMNKTKNQVDNVTIIESDCLSAVNHQCFDYILTNPLLELVRTLFIESLNKRLTDSRLRVNFMSSFKKQGMPSAKRNRRTIWQCRNYS